MCNYDCTEESESSEWCVNYLCRRFPKKSSRNALSIGRIGANVPFPYQPPHHSGEARVLNVNLVSLNVALDLDKGGLGSQLYLCTSAASVDS